MSADRRRGRPTMRDIAALAGVSLGTVHYVLNPGTRQVSPERRDRVLQAMRGLDYELAPRARRRDQTLEIGVVLPSLTNFFFGSCLEGIRRVMARGGHLMLAACHGDSVEEERRALAAMRRRRVAGLIFTPCWEIPAEVERMARDGLPVAVMDRCPPTVALNRVVMNIYESSFDATRLLLENGHRKIALINGAEGMYTSLERRRGYVDALHFAGLDYRPEYERCGPWTFEHGYQAAADLAALSDPPQASFISSPMLTLGALSALRERHLDWPDDVAIVGYGDPAWASLVQPPLTVIQQPLEQMGESAANLVLGSINTSKPANCQSVTITSHLVVRQSHWRTRRAGSRSLIADQAAQAPDEAVR